MRDNNQATLAQSLFTHNEASERKYFAVVVLLNRVLYSHNTAHLGGVLIIVVRLMLELVISMVIILYYTHEVGSMSCHSTQ